MLTHDLETEGRCARATLRVLMDELDRAECPPASAERLRRLARMAEEHVAAALQEPLPAGRGSVPRFPDVAESERREVADAPGQLADDASAAWSSATALRQAATVGEADHYRAELRAIAQRTTSVGLRRMCRDLAGPAASA